MDYPRRKAIAIIGLAQLGAILVCVLACNLLYKEGRLGYGGPEIEFMKTKGLILLIVPLIWVSVAGYLTRNEDLSPRGMVFLFGVGIVATVIMGIVVTIVWFPVFCGV